MKNILNNLPIKKNDCVIAGISGGADSMVLLWLLNNYRKTIGFKLIAVHINHNLREQESLNDQHLVENFCKKYKITLSFYSVDCKNSKQSHESIEQCARRLRYDCFNQELKKQKAKYLILAHHKNDNAETILLNLARGTGIRGAMGIKQTNNILRPFLNVSKTEIELFAKENNIPYCLDSTNLDLAYSRNFIRKKIFPLLETKFPKVQDNFCAFAERLKEDEEYFISILPKDKVKIKENEIVIDKSLLKLQKPISIRTLQYALNEKNWLIDFSSTNLLDILNLSYCKTNTKIDLPNNLIAFVEYNNIIITKKDKSWLNKNIIPFKLGDICLLNQSYEIKFVNDNDVNFDSNKKYLDYDKIPQDAIFRTRREGDKFKKLGSGTKKLNDYFTDKKIPLKDRDKIIVLASKNRILMVLNYDISEDLKIDSFTQKIISICKK